MWLTAALLAVAQAPAAEPLSPADAIAQAHADISRLPNHIRPFVRYISTFNLSPADRVKALGVLSGHVNSLSREPDITRPAVVPGTGNSLVRVNLLDYAWDAATWEKFADPYFSLRIDDYDVVPWEGGLWEGKYYAAGAFNWKRPRKGVNALAPWLTETPAALARLNELVGWTHSKSPVLSALYFVNVTGAAVDRNPNYYDFLGIKNEKTFQLLVGADVDTARRRKAIHREAVGISGVTLLSRAIERQDGFGSAYWASWDFKKIAGDKNPLKTLGADITKLADATEQYGRLSNGLWAMFLGNAKGEAQNTAPDNIASDGMSKSNDRRVHVYASCVRCHDVGGLKDIDGWVRNLLKSPLDLLTPDYEKQRELRREYLRSLEIKIAEDRAVYDSAIKEASGLTSKAYAAGFAWLWGDMYEDATVDLARAAADLGCHPGTLRKALDLRLRANLADTVLAVLILDNPRINRIPIRVWESEIASAHLLLRGLLK